MFLEKSKIANSFKSYRTVIVYNFWYYVLIVCNPILYTWTRYRIADREKQICDFSGIRFLSARKVNQKRRQVLK